MNLRDGENPEVGSVTGYRKLDDAELALVNKWKALGPELQELLNETERLVVNREAAFGASASEHLRALALAKTNLQQGAMWGIRAVAAPNGLV